MIIHTQKQEHLDQMCLPHPPPPFFYCYFIASVLLSGGGVWLLYDFTFLFFILILCVSMYVALILIFVQVIVLEFVVWFMRWPCILYIGLSWFLFVSFLDCCLLSFIIQFAFRFIFVYFCIIIKLQILLSSVDSNDTHVLLTWRFAYSLFCLFTWLKLEVRHSECVPLLHLPT